MIKSRSILFLQCCVTAALVLGFGKLMLPQTKTNGEDWIQDYISAKKFLQSGDPYTNLPEARIAEGFEPMASHPVQTNPHPPGAFLWLAPLGGLTYSDSLMILNLLNAFGLALAWNGAWRLFGSLTTRESWLIASAGGLFGAWGPIYQGFDFGQPSGLLAAVTVGLWWALRSDSPFVRGLLLGLACCVRPYFFLLSALGMKSGGKSVAWSIFGFAVGFGTPFVCVSRTPWKWWRENASHSGDYSDIIGTLPGILNIGSDAGIVFYFVGWLLLIVLSNRDRHDWSMSLGVALILWLYPLAWYHYDAIAVPVVAWLIFEGRRTQWRGLYLLAFAYLMLRFAPSTREQYFLHMKMQFAGRTILVAGLLTMIWMNTRGQKANGAT